MAQTQRAYLPAAGHNLALPLYDPLNKLLGSDRAKRALLDQAALRPNHRVLDIGCGTGTLTTLTKRQFPTVEVVGLDPDPRALARAKRKSERAGVSVRYDQGYADELPYPDAFFDRVFSSLMFHHLGADQRAKTLKEVRRVLVPGGSFHLLDVVRPEEEDGSWWTRLLHSNHHLKDNIDSRIRALLNQAGFAPSKRIKEAAIFFGLVRLSYYQAFAPMLHGQHGL